MLFFLQKLLVSLFTTSDIVILLWAAVTGWLCYKTWSYLKTVREVLFIPAKRRTNLHGELPDGRSEDEIKEDEDRLYEMTGKLNKWYSLFSGFTSVFPLWGMLGTVASLIRAAQSMTGGNVAVDEFFGALTSTAWGIIFAIIFKAFFDSSLAPRIEAANKEYDLLIERNSRDTSSAE